MKTLDYLCLDEIRTVETVAALQQLLAELQIFYSNVRGIHWNIKGHSFFTLQRYFEEMYTDLSYKADEVAERILLLGGVPASKYSDYLQAARIREVDGITSGGEAMKNILQSYKVILELEHSIVNTAQDAGDDVTAGMINGYIREQEKAIRMMTAFIS